MIVANSDRRDLADLRRLAEHMLDVVVLVDELRTSVPGQVSDRVAMVTARQWVNRHILAFGGNERSAFRQFERWKSRLRDLDLESDIDVQADELLGPTFNIDVRRLEDTYAGVLEAASKLELKTGRVRREFTREEIASELDVSTHIVHGWMQAGLPHDPGSGRRPHLFNLAEVKQWLTETGVALPRKRHLSADELVAAIEKHSGLRDKIAQELGVTREVLRREIVRLGLFRHPLLQHAKRAHGYSKAGRGVGRGAPGQPGLRRRGHALEVTATDTAVPFWLAALRQIRARRPGRGGGRAAAAAIGISPVSVTNLLQGKRVPGYEVMQQIMKAAGLPEPEWRRALEELVESNRSEVERARGYVAPAAAIDAVAKIVGASPDTIQQLVRGNTAPSMEMIRRLLEATGRSYLVESIEAPDTGLELHVDPGVLRDAIERGLESGWTMRDVADEIGVGIQGLTSAAERHGLLEDLHRLRWAGARGRVS